MKLPAGTSTVTATLAKKGLGSVLERVIRGERVVITKHQSPKAVLMSMEEYEALSGAASRRLEALSEEFDALLARMQTPKARTGMRAAFGASPKQLGRAAVGAVRRRN